MSAGLGAELEKAGLQDAPADPHYAGAEDVACDLCSGRKLRALKSCLVCLVSFCEEHLQPHYAAAALQRHRLVEPSADLQENFCSRHGEVMRMFCRTDQLCICYRCSVEEHKGHDTASAAAERAEWQTRLDGRRLKVRKRIQHREKEVEELQQEVEELNRCADEAVGEREEILDQLIRLIEARRSEMEQQVRAQQEAEARRVRGLQQELQQELAELRSAEAEMEKLSLTEDHNRFLRRYASLPPPPAEAERPPAARRPRRHFEDVAPSPSALRDRMQDVLSGTNRPEPKTRAELLRFSCAVTLDPETAHKDLLLSDGNRGAALTPRQQAAASGDRFTSCQVLSREGLTGRCYWEVDWKFHAVCVAVAYKDVSRESRFGSNDRSWVLEPNMRGFTFWSDNIRTLIPVQPASRIGVYLDHSAGVLCFYQTDSMVLLHRVQTDFTEPLHAGLRFYYIGDSAEFCKLRQTDETQEVYL